MWIERVCVLFWGQQGLISNSVTVASNLSVGNGSHHKYRSNTLIIHGNDGVGESAIDPFDRLSFQHKAFLIPWFLSPRLEVDESEESLSVEKDIALEDHGHPLLPFGIDWATGEP